MNTLNQIQSILRTYLNLKSLSILFTFLITNFSIAQSDRFVRIPYGWLWFLIGFIVICLVVAGSAYTYGKIRRPGKALSYAITASTHLFIWIVILLTLYPVIHLLAVSFNRNDSITTPLPKVGNALLRSGVLPDPSNFSLVQYHKLLSETHFFTYQWMMVIIIAITLLTIFVLTLIIRRSDFSFKLEQLRNYIAWVFFITIFGLIISINPDQFYSFNEAGEKVRASSNGKIILHIRNTLLVSGMTGIMAVFLSTTAGYAFARLKFEGRYQTLLSFVFVQMFPGFMALVALFYLMNALDLLNSFTGLILAYSGGAIAFSAWIFKGYLESINTSLEEAAMVDGATRWGAFWRIILPMSVPMLLFIFLLQFIGTYSEFILANIMLTGEDKWTVGIALRAMSYNQFNTQWGTLTASAVLGSIPILIIFYSFQNAFTDGYTAGSTKG